MAQNALTGKLSAFGQNEANGTLAGYSSGSDSPRRNIPSKNIADYCGNSGAGAWGCHGHRLGRCRIGTSERVSGEDRSCSLGRLPSEYQ